MFESAFECETRFGRMINWKLNSFLTLIWKLSGRLIVFKFINIC